MSADSQGSSAEFCVTIQDIAEYVKLNYTTVNRWLGTLSQRRYPFDKRRGRKYYRRDVLAAARQKFGDPAEEERKLGQFQYTATGIDDALGYPRGTTGKYIAHYRGPSFTPTRDTLSGGSRRKRYTSDAVQFIKTTHEAELERLRRRKADRRSKT